MSEGVNPYAAPMPEMGQGDALALSLAYASAQKQIRKEYEAENAKLRHDNAKLRDEVAELHCPNAAGFEGVDTYPDCGNCVVCRCKALKEREGNDE